MRKGYAVLACPESAPNWHAVTEISGIGPESNSLTLSPSTKPQVMQKVHETMRPDHPRHSLISVHPCQKTASRRQSDIRRGAYSARSTIYTLSQLPRARTTSQRLMTRYAAPSIPNRIPSHLPSRKKSAHSFLISTSQTLLMPKMSSFPQNTHTIRMGAIHGRVFYFSRSLASAD